MDDVFIKVTREDFEKRYISRAAYDALTAEVARLTGLLHAANVRKDALEGRVAGLEAEKDGAYSERDKLVSVLSKVYPASLERHQPENDNWENDWRWVVFVDTPTGQVSWHIHDSELPMFSHLRRNAGRVWDGHTTDEKYNRLARITPLEDALTAEVAKLRAALSNVQEFAQYQSQDLHDDYAADKMDSVVKMCGEALK